MKFWGRGNILMFKVQHVGRTRRQVQIFAVAVEDRPLGGQSTY